MTFTIGNKLGRGRPRLRSNELADGSILPEDAPAAVLLAKFRARQALFRAVRSGRKRKPTRCGSCPKVGGRIEAHHWKGYAQKHWLDVQWLCPQCHRDAHGLSLKRVMELPDFFTLAYGNVLSRTIPSGLPAVSSRGKRNGTDTNLYNRGDGNA